MTRIKRGGRELVVDDSDVTEYLAKGYSVIDDKGNELIAGEAIDYPSAMRRIAELEAYNASVQKTIVALEAENKKLKAENAKLKKPKE